MPTPMPIMAASSWPKVGTLIPWLMKSMTPKAMATPNRAVTMGRPMAITEPKASSRMMMAARMPTPSAAPKANFCTLVIGDPPSSIAKPGPALALALSITAWIESLGRSWVFLSNCTVPKAVCPSRLIWALPPGSNGLRTPATSGSPFKPASVSVMRACTAGDVTGSAVWKTTWASSPACEGKRWASRAWAWADSELPPLNLFSKTPCQTWLAPVITIRPTTQSSTTLRRLA